jgi:peptidoglycan/LPS O-acetylase OafA/YrhL
MGSTAVPRLWIGTGWLGLIGIIWAASTLTATVPFPGFAALFPVVGTAVVLIDGAHPSRVGPARLLGLPLLRLLGRLSYSWYLWHWPILVLALAIAPGLGTTARILLAVCALLVSAVTYAAVEGPLRYHRGLIGRPRRTLSLAAATTMLLLIVAGGWGVMTRVDLRSESIPRQQGIGRF